MWNKVSLIKRFREYSDAYSSATTIPAVSFSKKAKCFTEQWFWVLYFFVFYAVAVFYDAVPQLVRYLDEPTTSKITIVRNTSSGVQFPDAKLCIFFWPRLLDSRMDISDSAAVQRFLDLFDESEQNISSYIANGQLLHNGTNVPKDVEEASSVHGQGIYDNSSLSRNSDESRSLIDSRSRKRRHDRAKNSTASNEVVFEGKFFRDTSNLTSLENIIGAADVRSYSASSIQKFLTKFEFDHPNPQEIHDQRHSTLVYLTVAMLSALTRPERSTGTAKPGFENFALFNNFSHPIQLDSSDSLAAVYDFYVQRRTDFSELHRATAVALCQKLQLYVDRFDETDQITYKSSPQENCRPEFMLALEHSPTLSETDNANDALCIKLPKDAIQFNSTHDTLSLMMGPSRLYSGSNTKLQNHSLEAHLYLTQSDDSNPFMIRLRKASMLYTSLQGHYVSIPLRRKPCASETTRERCRRRCRNNFIVRHCHCRPLSLDYGLITEGQDSKENEDTSRTKKGVLPLCAESPAASNGSMSIPRRTITTVPLASCSVFSNLSSQLDPDIDCAQHCHQSCEYTVFEYHKETLDIEDIAEVLPVWLSHESQTVLSIRMKKFTYPLVQEVPSLRFRDLVGFVGGSFSMWMGINLPVMLHSVIFLVSYIIMRNYRRRQNSSNHYINNRGVDSSSGLQHTNGSLKEKLSSTMNEVSCNQLSAAEIKALRELLANTTNNLKSDKTNITTD